MPYSRDYVVHLKVINQFMCTLLDFCDNCNSIVSALLGKLRILVVVVSSARENFGGLKYWRISCM